MPPLCRHLNDELVMIGVCKLAMLVPSDGISPTGRQQVRVHLTVEVT